MKLSDNEIRDITKYLEEGKPLPDKYRFLLFGEAREVELVWNGKTSDITNAVLPFQTIEQIDEPRAEKEAKLQLDIFNLDQRGRQTGGWTNKLIWGDNKLILSSLKSGPLREEIEQEGGIKLIYIDPPFDVGADFSMDIQVGGEQFTKEPTVLEELAYRDTWGKGADSFIAMIYERLSLMKDLLADDGSIYVHCDYRVNSYVRMVLDELFGSKRFSNEIIWRYSGWNKKLSTSFEKRHDSIFFYTKSDKSIFNSYFKPWESKEAYIKARKQKVHIDESGREYVLSDAGGGKRVKRFLDDVMKEGVVTDDVWILDKLNNSAKEAVGYPTQKPKTLIERIISASSNEGDIVADFFVGSGTTIAIAEEMGRKWIGADLGKFSVHTSRKRMIEVQRQLRTENKPYRAFEILNLGKYERQHYVGVNPNLSDDDKAKQIAQREKAYTDLILRAYHAEPLDGFSTFYGKKNSRFVAIGPINLPVSRLFVEEVVNECLEKKITKADILAFEFEMGLFPHVQEEAKDRGVDLALKYIPPDVFDKRAIEKNQVVFYDVAFIEVKPHINKASVAIELTDFSVFYNQDTLANVESTLKEGGSKIIVENGQIIKVLKDKNGLIDKEILTKKWTDWIDYWSVDFNFESKKEIIRVLKPDSSPEKPLYEEVWTGDYIFENEWQSFRTKKERNLELTSVYHEVGKGRRKIGVKVVDIFGNDTMKVIEVTI